MGTFFGYFGRDSDKKDNSTEGNIINVRLQPKYSRFIDDHLKNESKIKIKITFIFLKVCPY